MKQGIRGNVMRNKKYIFTQWPEMGASTSPDNLKQFSCAS